MSRTRLAAVHQLALLVDNDAGERFGERDLAAVGRDLAGQQPEQGRLAGAVGPDQADAVAALDAQGEVPDDRALAEALEDMLGVDHGFRADIVLGQRQPRRARRAEHRRALGAHFVELGQAALVTAAACGDPALQPVELEL